MSAKQTAKKIYIGAGSVVTTCMSKLQKMSIEAEIDYEDTKDPRANIEAQAYNKALNEFRQIFSIDDLNAEYKIIEEHCQELRDEGYNEGIQDAMDLLKDKE